MTPDQIRERNQARRLLQMIEEISETSGLPTIARPLPIDLANERIEVYLEDRNYRLYMEALRELEK